MNYEITNAMERIKAEPKYTAYSALANLLVSPEETSLETLRIAILRNFIVEPVLPVVKGEIGLLGFLPDIYVGDFDAIAADAFVENSPLYQHRPDFIVIAQWLDTLSPLLTSRFLTITPEQVEEEIDIVIQDCCQVIGAIRKNTQAPILLNNFPLPNMPTLGIMDVQSTQYHTYSIMRLNLKLLEASKQFGDVYYVDYLGLFSRIGRKQAIDERHWQMARAPLGRGILVHLGQEYGKFFGALLGKTKKCLILDCDNVLWGGIIGEDGISGIQLGANYPGSSYQGFQEEILNLYHRGVILALCSKNNEADVLEVFDDHPETILKQHHFATWQLNWDDKATNLLKIAQDLNIGIDSLVFVDDSAFECEWVKKRLPQVATVHLTGDASSFRYQLSQPGFFDSLILSSEDQMRNEMYAAANVRKQMLDSSSSLEEYLQNLQIRAEIKTPVKDEIPRLAQLTQKTNQFNLTTKRYTEGDIQRFIDTPESEIFRVKLEDRISDLGIIGVAILSIQENQAVIDSFLLSCRALGRGVEDALLTFVVNHARNRGCTSMLGRYLITKKNVQVSEFYDKQGFQMVRESSDGTDWEYLLEDNESTTPTYPAWLYITR